MIFITRSPWVRHRSTDGIDTLEYQSACISVQEEFDQSIRSICAFSPTLNLPTVFPDGTVTYYFLQNGAFHFIDNFDEYMAQFIAAAQNPPITTLNPLNYSPGDTIALYMRWLPNGNVGVPGTGLCPKTLVLNIAVEADVTDCAAGIGNFVWNDQDLMDTRIRRAGYTRVTVTLTILVPMQCEYPTDLAVFFGAPSGTINTFVHRRDYTDYGHAGGVWTMWIVMREQGE